MDKDVQKELINLFEALAEREDEIKDIRGEMKDAIDEFCDKNETFEKKVVRDGFRFFKKLTNDKSSTVDEEYQRDKIVDLLMGTQVLNEG